MEKEDGEAGSGQRAADWQVTQAMADGRNSSRSTGMSVPQWTHTP